MVELPTYWMWFDRYFNSIDHLSVKQLQRELSILNKVIINTDLQVSIFLNYNFTEKALLFWI